MVFNKDGGLEMKRPIDFVETIYYVTLFSINIITDSFLRRYSMLIRKQAN